MSLSPYSSKVTGLMFIGHLLSFVLHKYPLTKRTRKKKGMTKTGGWFVPAVASRFF